MSIVYIILILFGYSLRTRYQFIFPLWCICMHR